MSNTGHQPRSESPLHYGLTSQVTENAPISLVVREIHQSCHLTLRGDSGDTQFGHAVLQVTGVTLPTKPGTYKRSGNTSIYWLGPNEWLVTAASQALSLESALRQQLKGHVAVVDVSGGQTQVNLSGEQVGTLLKKASVYDFGSWAEASDQDGRCTQTTFASASALVAKNADGSIDLIIRRSFSDYIMQWLLDAVEDTGFKTQA